MSKLGQKKQLLIHTGNILKYNRSKLNAKAEEEVIQGLGHAVKTWLGYADGLDLGQEDSLEIDNEQYCSLLQPDERGDMIISVKFFLNCATNKEHVSHVLDSVSKCIGTDVVDKLVVAKPSCMEIDSECFNCLWRRLETMVHNGKVLTLGVSDFDTDSLVRLHTHAQVKPSVTQVNLDTCCVVPPEMTAFAKENDIQILTHNDPAQLVTDEGVRTVLREQLEEADVAGWTICWYARYTVLIKQRGILKSKGYVIKLRRS